MNAFKGSAFSDKSLVGGVLIGNTEVPELHVMTWNIRRRIGHLRRKSPDAWNVRVPRIRALLQAEQPAILGVQEALLDQAQLIQLTLGPTYSSVGYGRGPKRTGESCPLFYDNNKLELLSWEQVALSDNSSQPGSVSWGNIVPRVMVVAIYRERATSKKFQVINTHFDHLSSRARLQSARAIARLVGANDLTTVVLGDLNAGAGSPALLELLAARTLVDGWEVAENRITPAWGTFGSYRAPRVDTVRIDWILVSPACHVQSVGINGWQYGGGWGSDHFPVQAVLRLPGLGDKT